MEIDPRREIEVRQFLYQFVESGDVRQECYDRLLVPGEALEAIRDHITHVAFANALSVLRFKDDIRPSNEISMAAQMGFVLGWYARGGEIPPSDAEGAMDSELEEEVKKLVDEERDNDN